MDRGQDIGEVGDHVDQLLLGPGLIGIGAADLLDAVIGRRVLADLDHEVVDLIHQLLGHTRRSDIDPRRQHFHSLIVRIGVRKDLHRVDDADIIRVDLSVIVGNAQIRPDQMREAVHDRLNEQIALDRGDHIPVMKIGAHSSRKLKLLRAAVQNRGEKQKRLEPSLDPRRMRFKIVFNFLLQELSWQNAGAG